MFHRSLALLVVLALPALISACSARSESTLPSQRTGIPAADAGAGQRLFKAVALPDGFTPYAIMADGRVTGSYGTAAAIYDRGAIDSLGRYDGADLTVAASVNALGDAVGYSLREPDQWHALLFTRGRIEVLQPPSLNGAPLDFVQALAINNRENILGVATDTHVTGSSPLLARYSIGEAAQLVPKPYPSVFQNYIAGQLYDVNSSGEYAFTEIPGHAADVHRAYRGSADNLVRLFPQYQWSSATWINDSGVIAGSVNLTNDPSFEPLTAYLYTHSGVLFLPFPSGATDMEPSGVNNKKQVVGNVSGPDLGARIFFYSGGSVSLVTVPQVLGASALAYPGLSDRGEFVVCGNSACYIMSRR